MNEITRNLQAVREKIWKTACSVARKPEGIRLLAVSKTHPVASLLEAIAAGQRDFGENYVQEGVGKIHVLRERLPEVPLVWHFIGPLQGNKTRLVAEHFDWVHTIDRIRIAERLAAQRPASLPPLQVCVQVNISGEATKSGVPPTEVPELCRAVAELPRLALRGLMSIPAPETDFERQRPALRALRQIFLALRDEGMALDTLSMGMTHDLEAAILEGSTLVRVGTAIFGTRETRTST
ncbi:MAG: YggS family pyridoxal phosphate-dependent enzyme [Zoogloeaceae bacterium]|jgi:pyridoxal phosphate enzyme (YggS family)|nr:YggS family pyridoxal phosphate-dependent enzyme [Zoogloeaceae bacterium]